MNFEETILRNLILNQPYRDKVLAFMDESYFEDPTDKMLYGEISRFIKKYGTSPSREALALIIGERGDLNEDAYNAALAKIKAVTKDVNTEKNLDWLVDESEKYCQERALYNAISDSIEILEGRDKKREKTIIPQILKDALAVSFQLTLGHSYKNDFEGQYEYYTNKQIKIPCDLHMINQITGGGVARGSLNVPLADTGVGKSIWLCHLAACYMSMGLNVVYFSMEMGERQLRHRIDANLLDMAMEQLGEGLDRDIYITRMKRIKNDFAGDIRIVEFGSGCAHAGTFRAVIDEYELKENFKPDVILVDYMAICASERWKPNAIRHDLYLQAVAEELRNLGKEYNVPVWSPHQSNRDGAETMDVGKKNTGNSYGILQTVDIMFALITSDDLQKRNQILVKQIKNRYGPEDRPRQFLLGLDKSKMRFYNLDSQAEAMVEEKTANLKGKMEERKAKAESKTGLRFE